MPCKAHNRSVLARARHSLGAIVILIVASSLAANAFADVDSSATAMACCMKANFQCAGLRAPDDCCQRMGHTAARMPVGTLAGAHSQAVASAIIAPSFLAEATSSLSLNAAPSFKRPHDPPHLHHYNPLI